MAPGRSSGHHCKWPLICHDVLDLIIEILAEMLIFIGQAKATFNSNG